jgi:hypothetical protein
VQLSAGYQHTCARAEAGEVWCWGRNDEGQASTAGESLGVFRPTRVAEIPPLRLVAAGETHTCGVSEGDGEVWCWGGNRNGGCDVSSTEVTCRRPVRLPEVVGAGALCVGTFASCATVENGAVRCWGSNNWGGLGDGRAGRAQPSVVDLDGVTHLAVAYQDHDWEGTGYHLYDLLSVAEDGSNLAVTYLYCQEGALPYAYTESFAHPMDWETASGSCDGSAQPSTANVSFPALTVLPGAFDPGVVINGDDVAWDGAEGHVTLGGNRRALRPFNTVDCTDCPGGPWLEVHALLDGDADACFGILYLFPDDPTFVQVSYGICLPTLERPEGTLDATWSGAMVGAPRPAGLVRPRPPLTRGTPR